MPTTDPAALTALHDWEWPEDPMPVLVTYKGDAEVYRAALDREGVAQMVECWKATVLPDLDAPQWGGVLLAALGEGWEARHEADGWLVWDSWRATPKSTGPTLARACAAALLARGRMTP